MGPKIIHKLSLSGLFGLLIVAAAALHGQQSAATSPAASSAASQRGLYLVFPFENAGSSPRLDWLGEGLEELTLQFLSVGGEQGYSHAGRAGEFEGYGLPAPPQPTAPQPLRLQRGLHADSRGFGLFHSRL